MSVRDIILKSGAGIKLDDNYFLVNAQGRYFGIYSSKPTVYGKVGDTFMKAAELPFSLGTDGNEYNDWSVVKFSPDGQHLVIANRDADAPQLRIFKRTGFSFEYIGAPASYSHSVGVTDIAFSSDGVYMATVHATSPYLQISKRSGDTYTKLANPATMPAGACNGVSFNPGFTHMSVACSVSPYIYIYNRSGDTFTKLSNPASLPTSITRAVAFSKTGVYLAITCDNAPYYKIYKRTNNTFANLSVPAWPYIATENSLDFSQGDTYLSAGSTMYKRSADTFTRISTWAFDGGSGYDLYGAYSTAFSYDLQYLAVALNQYSAGQKPSMLLFKRAGDTWNLMPNNPDANSQDPNTNTGRVTFYP